MTSSSLVNYKRYQNLHSELSESFKNQVKNQYYNYSELWKGLFSERNSSNDLADLLICLSDRVSFTKGIAGSLPDSQKNLFIDHYKMLVDQNMLNDYPMPWLGAPTVIDFDNYPSSISYLENLRLFNEVKQALSKRNLTKPLHILEIGAGYGGLAYFLLKSGLAETYTIIDLPENLSISSFYLTQIFQEFSFEVLGASKLMTTSDRKKLNFVSPGNIDALSDWQFDLAINTDSLGEMPAETAKSYIKWIHGHLTNQGYFFSKNGHNRGRDSIQFPNEYGYEKFSTISLNPPKVFSSLFDDFSHYIFLQKAEHSKPSPYPSFYFDVICSLYATGLQNELDALSEAYVKHTLSLEEERFLSACHHFFSSEKLTNKLSSFKEPFTGIYQTCIYYLLGITKFLLGQNKEASQLLKEYLHNAESSIAEAYVLMIISQNNPTVLKHDFKFGAKTRHAIHEILKFHSMNKLFKYLAFKLRADILRKKINYPNNYSPSLLITLKNRIFGLRNKIKNSRFAFH